MVHPHNLVLSSSTSPGIFIPVKPRRQPRLGCLKRIEIDTLNQKSPLNLSKLESSLTWCVLTTFAHLPGPVAESTSPRVPWPLFAWIDTLASSSSLSFSPYSYSSSSSTSGRSV